MLPPPTTTPTQYQTLTQHWHVATSECADAMLAVANLCMARHISSADDNYKVNFKRIPFAHQETLSTELQWLVNIVILTNMQSPFSLLIEGLAEDRTRAACVALSGAKRSANHYDPCLQTYEKQSQSVSNCRNKLYVTSRLLAVIAIFYPALSSATTLPSTGT